MKLSTATLLGVLFIGLKLTGYIQWPWVWVVSPFWIPIAILAVMFGISAILALMVAVIEFIEGK